MRIHLPNSAFLGNIDPFLRSIDKRDPTKLEITANEYWISVHPLVLSMIAATGLDIKHKNGHVEVEELHAKSRHYLERMGLFKILGVNTGISVIEHEPSGRFVPISRITNSTELDKFITDIVPLLHLEPGQAEPIRYVISELVRNVLEHARTPDGAIVCAQFYKKSNAIKIGVADTGIGIKSSINASYEADDDLTAIKLALTPGITGTTNKVGGTESNAGAGLFFIKSIAKTNRDFFVIYSGNAMYKLLKTPANKEIRLNADPFDDRCAKHADLPCFQGTAVGMDISLSRNQKFDYLLDLIRGVYRHSRKPVRNGFKRAKFI